MRHSRFLQYIVNAACLFSVCNAYSFTWQDLWVSPDKQAEALMKEGKFDKAGELFQQAPWKAAASYRAKNYKQAAQQFGALQSESGYYNQGNALAQMGQYQEALKAYDNALALNPANQDAIYNRKLVEELLKKNQDKQSDNKQQDDKNKQDQQDKKNQQNKSGNQDNQQNDNNQGKPEDKKQQDNKQQSGKDSKENQDKEQQAKEQQTKDQQAKEQQDKDSKTGEKPAPAKTEKTDKTGKEQDAAAQTAEEREKQQAKEQWLQLIPDDPGGLMREKFMRDYIRRQRGWQQ